MATQKPMSFKQWWKAIKRKPIEEQQQIFEKWLYYACKTIANRGDQNQARVVYTIATRYNKSDYKRMTRENAHRVFVLVNQKQYAHRKQAAEIGDLKKQVFDLQSQIANMARNPNNTKITTKKTRKVIHGGVKYDR